MVDPEMVLGGLKACADRTGALCISCPYKNVKDGCVSDVARDAFELLKHNEETIASLQNTINKLTKALAEKPEVVRRKRDAEWAEMMDIMMRQARETEEASQDDRA